MSSAVRMSSSLFPAISVRVPAAKALRVNQKKNLIIPVQNQKTFWSRNKPPPPPRSDASYKVVLPGTVSPQVRPDEFARAVPLPFYARTGRLATNRRQEDDDPHLHSAEEVDRIRRACALAKKILVQAGEAIRVGVTTDEIDQLVFDLALAHNAYPSPLNYRGFPKSVCTSVNNVVCHGIPDDRPLADGDIINVDVTVYLDGMHGDCSETFAVGDVDDAGKSLIRVTQECLERGIASCRPGAPFRAIGENIYRLARLNGMNVVGAFTGHGIGADFHCPPDIYHVPNDYPGLMEPGMVFTIEPVISEGTDQIAVLEDGWTAVTLDNSRAAQMEHTVLITPSGVEILTE